MKSSNTSFLRMVLYAFILSIFIVLPVLATWASSITADDVKLWKMWINLAISGYEEPMPMPRPCPVDHPVCRKVDGVQGCAPGVRAWDSGGFGASSAEEDGSWLCLRR